MMILIVSPACHSVEPGRAREVRVTLTEFSIQASAQVLRPGVPYRMVVTNRGQVNHELWIAPTGIQSALGEIASVDEMTLQPGTAHAMDVILPEAARSTGLEFACHLPGHYEFGMHLAITVR